MVGRSLINIRELSRLLTGDPSKIRTNFIPKDFEVKVDKIFARVEEIIREEID